MIVEQGQDSYKTDTELILLPRHLILPYLLKKATNVLGNFGPAMVFSLCASRDCSQCQLFGLVLGSLCCRLVGTSRHKDILHVVGLCHRTAQAPIFRLQR